jgi:UDP-N-acetylglucosamine 2-epimerase (non-hydrolysing)
MKQCVFVIGTRAQLVKVAPVLTLATEAQLKHVVWWTGQHNETIDDLIADFGIRSEIVRPENPRERSSVMRLLAWAPMTLFACLRYVKSVRTRTHETPLVIVHGDTLSTFLGALAGWIGRGWIVHLESGLSSGRITDPFPEEMLRRMTFRLTDFALCPNDAAFERMRGYSRCEAVHTGENTLLDCVRRAVSNGAESEVPDKGGYFVASIHRFQNVYKRSTLEKIVNELIALSEHGDVHFILHPATKVRLEKYGLDERLQRTAGIKLRPRMPYSGFLALLNGARGVISDGGSNQEELSYLGVPTVLLRRRSERPDGLGANIVLHDAENGSLAEFVSAGSLDALRQKPLLHNGAQPSQTVVESLKSWAR